MTFLFQYASCHKPRDRDALSQMSQDSGTSADSREPSFVAAGDIRRRLSENINAPKSTFKVRHVLQLFLLMFLCAHNFKNWQPEKLLPVIIHLGVKQ